MPHVTIQHSFDCDEETLWQICLYDEEFSRRLYLETLRLPRWAVVDQTVDASGLRRKVDIRLRIDNLPGALKSVLGEQFGYTEEGTFDRAARRYSYRMIPNAMADKTRIAGTMFTESRGEGQCIRTVDFEIDVKVMMIGRMIEQKTIDDTRATHEQIAAFTRQYIAERRAKA